MRAQEMILGFVLVTCAGLAVGQDALGDGRALDSNLSTHSRFNYERPNLADEIRFRNAIATGNAPGGMSFRGDVGYRAPGEFSGQLGSDDLFAFRRDSMYSGLAGMGIRGTEALQFQFALSTGQRPPQGLVGSLTYGRGEGQYMNPQGVPSGVGDAATLARNPVADFEEQGTMMWALRAPSAYEVNRGYQPVLLGGEQVESGEVVGVTASSLRGVRRVEMSSGPTGSDELVQTTAGAMPAHRIETSYAALLERLRVQNEEAAAAAAAAPGEETIPDWQRRLIELREQLMQPAVPAAPVEGETSGAVRPGFEGPFRADAETVERLLRATAPVQGFVPPDALGVYAEHMRVGQTLLASGRYFDAEERFAHALTIRPGDVSAQFGRINAQIGAGMFLSAAVNLRTVLLSNPEVATTRYEGRLMPSGERLAEVREQLMDHAGKVREGEQPRLRELRLGRAAGALLAYIGYQTRDRGLLEDGLAASRRALKYSLDDSPTVEDGQDQRLLDFLEQVWSESPGG
ncbi:MAG: hypothetical protein KF757_13860 [Phycisphaeraceae bacterium]|nr:hypothetical protein [Phycisphaeraceae bacterium]MCW5764048.1 hypothetical protein [Phycisphaeraceae bacterium]